MRQAASHARVQLSALPRALWVCAAIGVVNAACWAVITPSFWVPDEPSHAGYAQYLAETGQLPRSGGTVKSGRPEGMGGEQSLLFGYLSFQATGKPPWTQTMDRDLRRALASPNLPRTSYGQALDATSNPPLYYLLEAIPYRVFHGASYLDRLLAMRLFSALFAGLTVLFTYLFLRQLLPGHPWAWTTGALTVAFQPVFGFISGGINADALVYAAAAAVLWTVARAFRRGLDLRTGTAIGLAMAAGLLSKPIVIGLVPGLLVVFAVLALRQPTRRPAVLGAAAALGITLLTNAAMTALSASRIIEVPAADAPRLSGTVALADRAGYIWQTLLPRLPFMDDQFPVYPLWGVYFKGFIGRLGWNEYEFPGGWYWVALVIFAGIAALAGRALWAHRQSVWRRRWELVSYAALFLGLVAAVAVAGYGYRQDKGMDFEQARYLFPLLGLYGALIAVAAIGGGRRLGPAVGALLVVLAMGHSLFAMLLTLGRYYT